MTSQQKKLLIRAALAGGATSFALWFVMDRVIDKGLAAGGDALLERAAVEMRGELQRQLDAEVPPRIRATLDEVLREYGITPQTTSNVASILNRLG